MQPPEAVTHERKHQACPASESAIYRVGKRREDASCWAGKRGRFTGFVSRDGLRDLALIALFSRATQPDQSSCIGGCSRNDRHLQHDVDDWRWALSVGWRNDRPGGRRGWI